MAAEYLAATADQPLLCVEAVNPGLYTVVPGLAEAHRLRQQACTALQTAKLSQPGAELLVSFLLELVLALRAAPPQCSESEVKLNRLLKCVMEPGATACADACAHGRRRLLEVTRGYCESAQVLGLSGLPV